jgi:hypothetical protein
MMVSRFSLGAAAAAVVLATAVAQPAAAAVKIMDFSLHSGSWQLFGAAAPYGLPLQPAVTGSVTFDDTKTGSSALLDIDFVTGARSWRVADIAPWSDSRILYHATGPAGFLLTFADGAAGAALYTHATAVNGVGASVSDGQSVLYCNCLTVDAVRDAPSAAPEPAGWMLAILGFGAIGAATRSRRGSARPAA